MKCSHIQPNLIFALASASPTLKLATARKKIKYIFLVKEPFSRKLPEIPDTGSGKEGRLSAWWSRWKMQQASLSLPASGHLSNRREILTFHSLWLHPMTHLVEIEHKMDISNQYHTEHKNEVAML